MEERKPIGFARAENDRYDLYAGVISQKSIKIFTKDKIYSIYLFSKIKYIIGDNDVYYRINFQQNIKELTFVDMWKIKRESNVR